MPHETAALTAHALLALGERLGRAGATPSRPRDQVHSAKRLVDDGTLREWMARERRVVRAVVASGIQLLDLTAVHARYTPREWERIAESVRRIVEQVFDRKTSADDLYLEASLDSWIVLFGDEPTPVESDRRTRRIAEEISERLAGGGDGGAVDPADTLGVVKVHHITVELDRPPHEIRTLADLLLSWRRSYEAELNSLAGERSAAVTAWFDPEVAFWCDKRRAPPRGLAAVLGFRLRVALKRGLDVQHGLAARFARADLDQEAVRHCRRTLPATGNRSITITLSASTLDSAEQRAVLLDLLRTGGGDFDPLIDRGMYLEIDEIPTDIHHAQLLRALQPFMPLVAGIFVTIDPTSPRLQRFDGLGSKLLGFAVDGSRLHTAGGWRALLATADEVGRRPWRIRVHSIAHSPAAIALKRVAVVDRISGPAVAAALPAPFGPDGELAATSGGRAP